MLNSSSRFSAQTSRIRNVSAVSDSLSSPPAMASPPCCGYQFGLRIDVIFQHDILQNAVGYLFTAYKETEKYTFM